MLIETIIGSVVAVFLAAAIFMEIKNKNKKTDLFTNIVIAAIGLGSAVYMLYTIFNNSYNEEHIFQISIFLSEIATWVYVLVLLLSCGFIVTFVTFYLKNKDLPNVEDEEEKEEETVLSNEEIEEILEQENNVETSEEENVKTEKEVIKVDDDTIELESLTAQKPKVLKPDEEEFKFKEGATQVPENQRNPFIKK